LYNASASRYVKLDDIARMIREGIDVQVQDTRTGKDLNYMTLAQIVVEDARERETALPLQLLQQLVRASDKARHDFLSWLPEQHARSLSKGTRRGSDAALRSEERGFEPARFRAQSALRTAVASFGGGR
jgi:polyhydroxyalkanoate synthesis repressor PhaR